jgi:HAMP domain-containing protein
MTDEQTPRTGFNVLLMVEAMVAICIALAGVLYFAFKLESRVSVLEEERHRDAQSRDASKRDSRIDRIESALEEQARMLKQLAPRK